MVLLLLLLVVILGMVAFAVDVGMMELLRAETQNAVDAAALAATLRLQDDSSAIDEAEAVAKDFVQRNRVGTLRMVPIDAIQVERGVFDQQAKTFTATMVDANAVRVFARQDNEPFYFARIFGYTTFGAPATAVSSGGSFLDIMLVLDLSYSMNDEGRIQALWDAAPVFVDVIESFDANDQIGVMGLSANPDDYDPQSSGHSGFLYGSGLHPGSDYHVGVMEATLTDDFNYLRNVVLTSSALAAGKYVDSYGRWRPHTGTGASLGDAAHYLTYGAEARPDVDKVIVLMSDGEANKPSGSGSARNYALQMANYAQSNDVAVYTISLGSGADVELMQDIAAATGGQHFDATGGSGQSLTQELEQAFRHAAGTLKRAQLVK